MRPQFELLDEIGEKSFFADETLKLLNTRQTWLWSWGARNYRFVPSKKYEKESTVFYFRVSGNHHKGYVVITLGWNDTYIVRLVNMKWAVKETITDVYFDNLCEVIDTKVERIEKYQY